jgi:hypothetical protein
MCRGRLSSRALAASDSRFFGAAVVSSDASSRVAQAAISSMAAAKAASFAFDGLANPLIFRTNCSDAARTSSDVTGGSKLKSGRMFLHMAVTSVFRYALIIGAELARQHPHFPRRLEMGTCGPALSPGNPAAADR